MSSTVEETQSHSQSGFSIAVFVGLVLSLFGGTVLGRVDLP